jgi:hypothetical protein
MPMLVYQLIEKLQASPKHAKIEIVIDGNSITADGAEYDEDVKRK